MDEFVTKVDDLKTLESGAKRDNAEGKGSYDLISPFALKRLALVYERGVKQKGARNWEKGIPLSRCLQSSIRHIYQYIEGLRDEDHLMQAAWNLFAVVHFEELIKRNLISSDLNDLPNYSWGDFKNSIEKANGDFLREEIKILNNIKKEEINLGENSKHNRNLF